jgi:hypothetical protein
MKREYKPKCVLRVAFADCRKVRIQIQQDRDAIKDEFGTLWPAPQRLVHLTLNEAEALAWQTEYPHLIFPTLAREKIQALASWQARQSALRRSGPLLAFAE